jgi:putative transposase
LETVTQIGKEAKMYPSFRAAVAAVRRSRDLYFAALLPEEIILESFGSARWTWHGYVYTPAVTVWVFLSQCMSQDHSCREAVARLAAWLIAQGRNPCSPDTGAYCTAREELPEPVGRRLVSKIGKETEDLAPGTWLWKGRRVRIVDGSTVTMPDTAENQAEYPQMRTQKPGCGLPIARVVVIFCLAVGTALDAAIGPYKGKQTGENVLFRALHDVLERGDVVLADRYYSGWFDLALLKQRGADFVVRKHQLRANDFRTGRRLGRDDHVVRWKKPERPAWMSAQEYAALDDELKVREVRVRVLQTGFRTRELIVVTSLLDHQTFSAEDIATIFRRRWRAELDLRSIKVVLQMDHLRCKTPHRVRNEFWMHLLAYNLIRRTMAIAAMEHGVEPCEISFKGTLQTLGHFLPLIITSNSPNETSAAMLRCIAAHVVGNRPDRFEPRVRKRRPKEYDLMNKPRHEYKRQLAK